MAEIIELTLWMIFSLLAGLCLLYLFARFIGMTSDREDQYKELESNITMRQVARNAALIELLWAIKGGHVDLWDTYNRLNDEDERLTRDERKLLIEADPTVISDKAYHMLYGDRDES